MTQVLDSSASSIARAAECLRAGGLVAFPTETVYGLGAHALDAAAVQRLFDAKGRPANDPLIVHLLSIDDAMPLVEDKGTVIDLARRLAARFWPGPLTLVLRKSARVPREVTAGLGTVAVRAPSHRVARALLEAARIPVAAPSANLFSRPSPTRAEHVLQDLEGRIDMVLDGGPTPVGVESTVLDLTADLPTVLRPGAVSLEQLREVMPDARMRETAAGPGPLPSPGLLEKHYAPRAPISVYEGPRALERLEGDAAEATLRGQRVGILVPREHASRFQGPMMRVADLGPARDRAAAAGRLYAALRELDTADVDSIMALGVDDEEGLGAALRDRLRRAAAGRIIRT